MKFNLLLFCFLIVGGSVQAQYSYAKSEEFANIQARPLIVEQLELDTKLIEKWEKKAKKAKKAAEYNAKISKYKAFVTDYNTLMNKAVEEHWGLNSGVTYKTTSEVKQMMKDDSEEYTVLWYSETDSKRRDEYGATYFPNLTAPTLNYSRIEKGRFKTDYCYFMHFSHKRAEKVEYSDFVLSLKLMKQHMDYIVANDKKKYAFHEYAEDQAEENCKDLPNEGLFLRDASIHKKSTLEGINSTYGGTVATLTDEEIQQAIEQNEDRIVGMFFPFSIVVGNSGPLSVGRVQYVRCFVNIKTGKIYTAHGSKMGQFFDAYYREKEFKKYKACD